MALMRPYFLGDGVIGGYPYISMQFSHESRSTQVRSCSVWINHRYTHPQTNSKFAPENMPKLSRKETILFQPSIFRCKLAVSFREGKIGR